MLALSAAAVPPSCDVASSNLPSPPWVSCGHIEKLEDFQRIFQEAALKTRKPKQCLEETGSSIAILAHVPVILSSPAFAISHGAATGVSQTL